MKPCYVQSLVLRAAHGPAVAHLVVRIPNGAACAAAGLLKGLLPSFGPRGVGQPFCSIGFSFAGLEALGLPEAYLRLFRRLAPAFRDGAVRRSVQLGDQGASAAQHWHPAFRQDAAHVLLSWHGPAEWVREQALAVAQNWKTSFGIWLPDPFEGHRLGAPEHEAGEWMHFGYRDGLSEICIDDEWPRPAAPDCRRHEPGALLLGEVNDGGFNPFVLNRAPDKVRTFFSDSSFGIFRPIVQNLIAFDNQVSRWATALAPVLPGSPEAARDFVKAKLCGRWPNGRQPRPGDLSPSGPFVLDLGHDPLGQGCPFGSHVRRMRAAPEGNGSAQVRPLQRRGMPFGPAAWSGAPTDGKARGLLGHFFCASIEDQFEHLVGQWAARPPLGSAVDDGALDPMIGQHDDPDAALMVPLKDRKTERLRGFGAWTTTRGTMYAWHPGFDGLRALLEQDFLPKDDEGPWL